MSITMRITTRYTPHQTLSPSTRDKGQSWEGLEYKKRGKGLVLYLVVSLKLKGLLRLKIDNI